jgi:hypothetical protein
MHPLAAERRSVDMPLTKRSTPNKARWGSRHAKVNGAAEPQSRRAHKTQGNARHGRTSRRAKA